MCPHTDELMGKSGDWLVHPEDREGVCAALSGLAAGREVRDVEYRVRSKDGRYRWVSWFAVEDGHIYASGRDVTNFRKAREELETLRRRIAEA
ncbi:MAG TPA: PAS domain-containing protein [Xanthobacteraceae bacterium]|jgi:PAS domain S-box-containing protein|nr:PAS domain-containing protein [Xanthobacteraceae bacterium]